MNGAVFFGKLQLINIVRGRPGRGEVARTTSQGHRETQMDSRSHRLDPNIQGDYAAFISSCLPAGLGSSVGVGEAGRIGKRTLNVEPRPSPGLLAVISP